LHRPIHDNVLFTYKIMNKFKQMRSRKAYMAICRQSYE